MKPTTVTPEVARNGGRPDPATREGDREARYQAALQHRQRRHEDACKITPALLSDLFAYAESCPDGLRAAGRYDVVAKIRAWQQAPPPMR